jgi:hypothetical protein
VTQGEGGGGFQMGAGTYVHVHVQPVHIVSLCTGVQQDRCSHCYLFGEAAAGPWLRPLCGAGPLGQVLIVQGFGEARC